MHIKCILSLWVATLTLGADSVSQERSSWTVEPLAAEITLADFLALPPNIAECVVEVCRRRPQGEPLPPRCVYVLLRWQTNAFLYREAPSLDALFSTNVQAHFKIFAKYDTNYWYLDPQGMTITATADESKVVSYPAEKWWWVDGAPIYNIGIFDSRPGTIHFSGNTLLPFTNANGLLVTGQVLDAGSASTKELLLHVRFGQRDIPWIIEYTYAPSSSLPPGFPHTLKASVLSEGQKLFQYSVTYLTLSLTPSSLPKDLFEYQKFLRKNIIEVVYIANEGFFRDPLTGKLRPVVQPAKSQLIRLAFVSCSIFLLGTMCVFWLRRRQVTQHKDITYDKSKY